MMKRRYMESILEELTAAGTVTVEVTQGKKGKKTPAEFEIRDEGSIVVTAGSKHEYTIPLDDILFIKSTDTGFQLAAMSYPGVYVKRVRTGCLCKRRKVSSRKDREIFLFDFSCSDKLLADRFVAALNEAALGSPVPEKHEAVVVVNPVAGKGTAEKDWREKAEFLISHCGKFNFSVHITDRKHHAMEIGRSLAERILADPSSSSVFFAIVLGGDGVVYEMLNGIYLNFPSDYLAVLKRIAWCPLPSGSGNGLCFSSLCLAKEPFTMNCALRLLLRKKVQEKDLGMVEFEDDFDPIPSRLFSLTLSWGLVADVDINSEFLRKFFGDARFTIYGLAKVVQKREYSGHLSWDESHEIEPDYLTVYATLVPVAGRTVVLDPSKPMADSTVCIHRLRGRDVSRLTLVRALDELAIRRDHCMHIPGFEPIRTKNFELVPDLTAAGLSGYAGVVVDGEPLTKGPIKVRILPSATYVLVS